MNQGGWRETSGGRRQRKTEAWRRRRRGEEEQRRGSRQGKAETRVEVRGSNEAETRIDGDGSELCILVVYTKVSLKTLCTEPLFSPPNPAPANPFPNPFSDEP
jgi:hypothetical protein